MSKQRNLNKVVVFLSLSDVFSWGPYLIISALSGLYLSKKLALDAVQVVGIGTAIYYTTRAAVQIPLGRLTDKMKSDKDEIALLFLGSILMGFPFIFYPLISHPAHYYVLQFIFGVGVALSLTNWRKLFAINVDKGKEGTQYSFYELLMSGGTALFSALVGVVGNLGEKYFDIIIVSAGIVMILATVWIILIYKTVDRKSLIKNS